MVSKYNTKNYTEQGGTRTVIGGDLNIVGDGRLLRDGVPVDLGGSEPVSWNDIQGKPATFPPSSHNHDERYYTQSQVDNMIADLQRQIDDLSGGAT